MTTALVLIVEHFCNSGILSGHTWIIAIPAITIIGREIAITALREWMAKIGKVTVVAVSLIGKRKTTFQMMAIAGLIWNVSWDWKLVMVYLALVLLYVAVVLTFWSMLSNFSAASGYFSGTELHAPSFMRQVSKTALPPHFGLRQGGRSKWFSGSMTLSLLRNGRISPTRCLESSAAWLKYAGRLFPL